MDILKDKTYFIARFLVQRKNMLGLQPEWLLDSIKYNNCRFALMHHDNYDTIVNKKGDIWDHVIHGSMHWYLWINWH